MTAASMIQTFVQKMARRVTRVMSRELFARVYVLLTSLSTLIGAVVLLGGPRRFSDPELHGPRELASIIPFAAPWVVWGAIFLAHGIWLAYAKGHRIVATTALRFGTVVYAFLSITFVVSLRAEPQAAALGLATYPLIAALYLFTADHVDHYGWESGHGDT